MASKIRTLGLFAIGMSLLLFLASLPLLPGGLASLVPLLSQGRQGAGGGMILLPVFLLLLGNLVFAFAYIAARLVCDHPPDGLRLGFFGVVSFLCAWLLFFSAHLCLVDRFLPRFPALLLTNGLAFALFAILFRLFLRRFLQPIRQMEDLFSVSRVHAEQLPDVVKHEAERERWLRFVRSLPLAVFTFFYLFLFLFELFFAPR